MKQRSNEKISNALLRIFRVASAFKMFAGSFLWGASASRGSYNASFPLRNEAFFWGRIGKGESGSLPGKDQKRGHIACLPLVSQKGKDSSRNGVPRDINVRHVRASNLSSKLQAEPVYGRDIREMKRFRILFMLSRKISSFFLGTKNTNQGV